MTPIFPADDRFLRLPEVVLRVGVSESTVFRLIQRNEFPRPVKVGRSSVWPESAIREWQAKLVAAGQ